MEATPIVCTLGPTDLRDRQKAWQKVGTFGKRCIQVPGGLSFEFKPAAGVRHSLEQLIRLEGECCPWMRFVLDDSPEKLAMTVTATGEDGQAAVRETFAPLVAAVKAR